MFPACRVPSKMRFPSALVRWVYTSGTPTLPPAPKKVTLSHLSTMKAQGRPIVVMTAYDSPTAATLDACGVDVILVGDSVGMVMLGHPTTTPVTLEAMVHHCAAVSRGPPKRALLVGDLPFGSYPCAATAVASAARLIQGGGMACVKLEGGVAQAPKIRAVVEEGMPVMGHVGLLPQTATLGAAGYGLRGRTPTSALRIIEDALAVQEAGARACVVEVVPSQVAAFLTALLHVPTIGIGAGPGCSGQVLVVNDALGWGPHAPPFAKRFREVGRDIEGGVREYVDEVVRGVFPGKHHTKSLDAREAGEFLEAVQRNFSGEKKALAALKAQCAELVGGSGGGGGGGGGGGLLSSITTPPLTPPSPPPPPPPPPSYQQQQQQQQGQLKPPSPLVFPTPTPSLSLAVVGSGALGSLLAASFESGGFTPWVFSGWGERVSHLQHRGLEWRDACSTGGVIQPQRRARFINTGLYSGGGGGGGGGGGKGGEGGKVGGDVLPGLGSFDVVLIAGKATQVAQASALAWRLVKPGTGAIIPLYNGGFTFEYLCLGGGGKMRNHSSRTPTSTGTGHQYHSGQVAYGVTSMGASLSGATSMVARTGLGGLSVYSPWEDEAYGVLKLPHPLSYATRASTREDAAAAATAATADVSATLHAFASASGGGDAPVALRPSTHAKFARLTKLAINSILNPLAALTNCSNGELAKEVGVVGSALRGVALELAAEAWYGLECSDRNEDREGVAGIKELGDFPGWEGVRDGEDVLEMALGVARATAPNINSMLADVRGGRLSEVDFISGGMIDAISWGWEDGAPWNMKMLKALHAREEALGVRNYETTAAIKSVTKVEEFAGGYL